MLKKIEDIYRSKMFVRYEENEATYYYSASDFDGLNREKFDFKTKKGDTLSGAFYSYASPREGRLVIFEHGVGGGHRSYMQEINRLCLAGYRVFAYDHTGCVESEGENIGGFSQSMCDLDSALGTLKSLPEYKGCDFSVVGHSWGGLSTLCVAPRHKEVKSLVALSAPISVGAMLGQCFPFPLSFMRKRIFALERESNPDYVDITAADSLSNYGGKALLVYSSDDKIVSKKYHYDVLKAELEGKPNIEFLLVDGKGHNPNYTENAVKKLGEFFAKLETRTKSGELSDVNAAHSFRDSIDWAEVTEQDGEIWDKILATIG